MSDSNMQLKEQSDGFWANENGDLAVVVNVSSGHSNGVSWFGFVTRNYSPVRVEWNTGDKAQVFHSDAARYMVNMGWAKKAGPEEIEWLQKTFSAPQEKKDKKQ
jgi:hypothetical protein